MVAAQRALQAARSVVATGYGGRQVEVDTDPRCQHCGKRVAKYLAIPWSLRCQFCRSQASNR